MGHAVSDGWRRFRWCPLFGLHGNDGFQSLNSFKKMNVNRLTFLKLKKNEIFIKFNNNYRFVNGHTACPLLGTAIMKYLESKNCARSDWPAFKISSCFINASVATNSSRNCAILGS